MHVSEVGDAYSLGANFGKYFSRMLVSGKEPKGLDLSLPSGQRLNSALGGKPKYAACDAFGRSPGLAGVVADKVGAPPEWTDKQPKIPDTTGVDVLKSATLPGVGTDGAKAKPQTFRPSENLGRITTL